MHPPRSRPAPETYPPFPEQAAPSPTLSLRGFQSRLITHCRMRRKHHFHLFCVSLFLESNNRGAPRGHTHTGRSPVWRVWPQETGEGSCGSQSSAAVSVSFLPRKPSCSVSASQSTRQARVCPFLARPSVLYGYRQNKARLLALKPQLQHSLKQCARPSCASVSSCAK